MKNKQRQTALEGAGVMGLSLIIVKLLGALYKIPLNNLIGSEGYTYFLNSYDIYSLLLVVSTAGLPVAMSRMVAAADAVGNRAQVRQIKQASLLLFSALGIIGTLIMTVGGKKLASVMGIPDGTLCILALSPAVLFVCLSSCYRGYFQGQSIMTPSGVSQIIEAVCKLMPGLLLAWLIRKRTGLLVPSVAGAILGVTIGEVIAFAYLYLAYRRFNAGPETGDSSLQAESLGATVKELLIIGVPITIGSAGLQLFSLIDDAMIMDRLQEAAGLTYQAAKSLRGLYGTAQTIFNLPGALMTAFTATAIPAITACIATGDQEGAKRVANSEIRVMTLVILPCAVGMGVLGTPIIRMLYRAYSDAECAISGSLLSMLAICVIINGLVLMMNTILQAHNYARLPVYNMLAGGVLKIAINYLLVGIPGINIYGAPVGTAACFILIAVLDVIAMRRKLGEYAPRIFRLMAKCIVACAIMGAAAFLSNLLLSRFLSVKLACVGAIGVAVVVYVIEVLVLKLITYEECRLLPKGEKIAAMLHIH